MPDRHREKPLSLRLGPDRDRLERFARERDLPVRRVVAAAVTEYLDEHDTVTARVGLRVTEISEEQQP